MQRAKRNVEEHYAVVGILEEMDLTLQVLENYVPRFFSGATKLYYGPSPPNIQYPFYEYIIPCIC
jgi:hypothetical protein